MTRIWNPWHGCRKYSEGCLNCYVFRIDSSIDKRAEEFSKNKSFYLPLEKNSKGYVIPSGSTLYTCLSSDFFLDSADAFRGEAWRIIKEREDVEFIIITKRILRFYEELPSDWGDGYPNVTVLCTCENQKRADERLPFFISLPIRRKGIVCEPLLERIRLLPYLEIGEIQSVTVGGESGQGARACDYDWVLGIRDDCISANVSFHFKQTGANFRRNGKTYDIPRKLQHSQASRAGIDFFADSSGSFDFDRENTDCTDTIMS